MATEIPECEPRIIEGPRQFVAVSPPILALRIGVVAPTEAEARNRFREELQAWRELRAHRLSSSGEAGGHA